MKSRHWSIRSKIIALIAVPLAACLNGVVRHLVTVAQDYQDQPEDDVGTEPEPA